MNEEGVEDSIEETGEKEEKIAGDNVEASMNEEVNGKTVYLTFDDGPSSASIEILDILDQFDAKATFFMLEPEMRTHPDIVNRTVKDGHAVALHCVTHDRDKIILPIRAVCIR
ncbi:polysaccharide deacetylase family protein [Evansella halocellulosilytica]|uniref:polysaccharide deacetylase family protein n=1 Tax=Evansella halocellulosilytica TaxID=2011013 RepID=UPI000BB9B221|nr:polysaccharide deacetylase family protein [Evansella halocellulosilytica]